MPGEARAGLGQCLKSGVLAGHSDGYHRACCGRGNFTDQELTDLVERTADSASAIIRGDIRRHLTLIRHADDYTLMAPSGGEPRRGFDASDQAVEALAEYFRGGGEADLQVFESYSSGDLVVLVAIERGAGQASSR